MTRNSFSTITWAFLTLAFLTVSGCNNEPAFEVESYVEGTLSIRAEVDSGADFSGFRVSVLTRIEGDVDTLGTAVTTASGAFAMNVRAHVSGVFPMVVERSGTVLSVNDFVVSNGDSARVNGSYPLNPSGLRIISSENVAWSAYRNAKAGHNQQMLEMLRSEAYVPEDIGRITAQTSTVLWSIPAAYPSTIGGELAMAESIVMMEGWNDSTVAQRLPLLSLKNNSLVEVVSAARRSIARLAGQDSALAMLDYYLAVSPEERHPGIMAEKIIAYADSFQNSLAVQTATLLKKRYPTSEWSAWAARATYELENLQPGMNAPAFSEVSRKGADLSTAGFKGKFLILEFFNPSEPVFQREFADRDNIAAALDPRMFITISLSVEPDSVVNEALFDGDSHAGYFVWLPMGMDSKIVSDFNVQILPTRYLIDPSGQIVRKYSGPGIVALEEDLASIVTGLNGITKVPVLKKIN
jgi:hypothetical protein